MNKRKLQNCGLKHIFVNYHKFIMTVYIFMPDFILFCCCRRCMYVFLSLRNVILRMRSHFAWFFLLFHFTLLPFWLEKSARYHDFSPKLFSWFQWGDPSCKQMKETDDKYLQYAFLVCCFENNGLNQSKKTTNKKRNRVTVRLDIRMTVWSKRCHVETTQSHVVFFLLSMIRYVSMSLIIF